MPVGCAFQHFKIILQERMNLHYINKDIVEVETTIFHLTRMSPGKLWKLPCKNSLRLFP